MAHWTILWITLAGGPFGGESFFMVYPSLVACQFATSAVSETLAYDHSLRCAETGVVAASVRPKARSAFLGEGGE